MTILHKLILEQYFGIDSEKLKEQSKVAYTRSRTSWSRRCSPERCSADSARGDQGLADKEHFYREREDASEIHVFWPKLVTGLVLNKFE